MTHVVVVVLHMPGLARWLTPGRSSCGSTLFVIIFFIMYYLFIFALLLLLLSFSFRLLSLLLLPASSSCGRLPFLAGEVSCLFLAGEVDCLFWQEVGCLFGRIFFRVWRWYHVWGLQWRSFLCSVTDLTKDESPHTGYTFTPWVVSFTPPSIEHQVGGTSILRLFRRTCREPWYRFSVSRLGSLAGVVTRNRVLNSGHPSKYWLCRMTA